MTTTDIDAKQAVVDAFNAEHAPGVWVRYWTGTHDDAPKYGQTRTKAELLGGHTPVVWVTTHSACVALTHVDVIPGQPDGIEYDTGDLPDPVRAAQRVMEYIGAFGDGIYDVTTEGHPLYARDIESLRQAAIKATDVDAIRAELTRMYSADMTKLRAQVDELTRDLAFARDMANAARAQAADLLRALDHARAVVEAAQAWREWYAESPVRMQHLSDAEEALFAAVDALPKTEIRWSMPAEPTDITAVRDRTGQLWVCPGRPGDNLWWRDHLGRGTGYEWHQILRDLGPLTPATKAGVAR